MQFTEEHDALRRVARQFVEKELNPNCEKWEEQGFFPLHEIFGKMGELGLLGICKPEENGGLGLDYSYNLVVTEEIGRCHSGGVALAIGVQTDMSTPAIARFATKELREKYLDKAILGEYVASIAVSEPHAGSDVAAIKTTAVKDGDDYVINGTKMWITNAIQGDFLCLLANTSDGNPHTNKSLIIVPNKTPGITFAEPLKKLGMRSTQTCQIFFDNVRVPQSNLIGQEGAGFMMQMMQFQEERLWGSVNAVGGMDRVIEETINYCRQRNAFGKSILDNQVVHFRLAELKTEVEALRALTYRACELHVAGQDVTELASMAKLKAGRLTREVSDACLQYWGGMGFMWENPAGQLYRDGRLASIGGGADEVMLGIICKTMGTLPMKKK